MKLFLLLCTVLYCTATAVATVGDFMDQVDTASIMANKELLTKVFNCLLDREPCGDFQSIKEMVPKLLISKCGDCNANQKKKYDAALEKFKTEYYDMYKAVMDKYVPGTPH